MTSLLPRGTPAGDSFHVLINKCSKVRMKNLLVNGNNFIRKCESSLQSWNFHLRETVPWQSSGPICYIPRHHVRERVAEPGVRIKRRISLEQWGLTLLSSRAESAWMRVHPYAMYLWSPRVPPAHACMIPLHAPHSPHACTTPMFPHPCACTYDSPACTHPTHARATPSPPHARVP